MEVKCLALKDLTSPRKGFTEEDGGHGDQKENIYAERRRSTPLKSAEDPGPVLTMSRKAPPLDLAHVTPIKHTPLAEPWTPTANLKMLISAAGPDIRDREMKKVLFRPIENEKPESPDTVAEDTEVDDSCQFEAGDEEDDTEKKPSRKQKSLGLLCQKFLALYPDYPPQHCPIWISLDEVSTSLGVERRRIYDIVNVLESLMLVGRIAKNSYSWYGRLRLEATLAELQRRGREQGYHLQMDLATEGRGPKPGREDDGAEGDAVSACGNRKDKSLRIMSQKFVMLFLVSKTQTVTLDAAAKILIEESQDSSSHSKYKTKVRRLYDIANVLTSLRLIKKVHVREERGRKPAFKWLGPVDFKSSSAAAGNSVNGAAVTLPQAKQTMAGVDFRGAKLARHASFNVTPSPLDVQRLVNSAPSSPRRDVTGLPSQPVDYSKKTPGNSAVCRLQFGSTTDNRPTCTSDSPLAPSSARPVSRAPHPDVFATSSSSPHCLAYLSNLSQPSVVMLYQAPDTPDWTPEGPRSPGAESDEGRKRRRDEEFEGGTVFKKQRAPAFLGCDEGRDEPHREAAEGLPAGHTRTSPSRPVGFSGEPRPNESHERSEPALPSHYLYVPNNAGLNNLNFLFSAGQSTAGLALPQGGVPTLALPYVLMPSAALSHYPLVAGGLPAAVMSPAHFMVAPAPYSVAAPSELNGSAAAPLSNQEHSRLYGSVTGSPHSPPGLHQTVSIRTPEPPTPHTPKESTSASKAFFQTPGTLGSAVSSAPAARKRGSAQRRLDVGHPPTNQLDMKSRLRCLDTFGSSHHPADVSGVKCLT
ncbi:transcription factor E2F7 [Spinachia spinachia]